MRNSEGRARILDADIVPWELLAVDTYRGVVVGFDEDRDERVYKLIDAIKADFPSEPLFVSEHEAEVVIVWRGSPPEKFATRESVEIDHGDGHSDSWSIRHSAISK